MMTGSAPDDKISVWIQQMIMVVRIGGSASPMGATTQLPLTGRSGRSGPGGSVSGSREPITPTSPPHSGLPSAGR